MPNDKAGLWREADALFDRLLDLPVDERTTALAAMAPEPALHAAVERLFAAHDTGGLLDRAVPATDAAPTVDALRGKRMGRWQLEHEIGRGGMAVVYRAHAADGTAQVAALKLLTLGAWARRGSERFQQEQSMLARLRHAHIAPLFESGIADDGTPWLAMALVEGERIDRWCERHALSPRAIVGLFLDVCDAVAYAHRNLVIHRDLKPSNVLVDHDGHVRLLDFGIARLVDEHDEVTASQWRALTPDYAAPEQFSGAAPSTAMDVYGLGALLYRLLVGRPPRAAHDDAQSMPAVPSRALARTRIAATIRGDLDAVLLKALAHDPARRYDSVAAFAHDLDAWLARRPVIARAQNVSYRVARFAARHKAAVAGTGAVLFALLIGTAAALWQAERAGVAAQRARSEAESAVQQAQRATAIKKFMLSLFEATNAELPDGAAVDSREILRRGVERITRRQELAADLRIEVLVTIAAAQRTMAWYDDARAASHAAAALIAQTPTMPALRHATVVFEQAMIERVDGSSESASALLTRAEALADRDHSVEADELRAAVLTQRGILLTGMARESEAIAAYEQAQHIVDRLPAAGPQTRQVLAAAWGSTAFRAGDYPTALSKLRESYAMQRREGNEGNASIASTLNHLATASASMGRFDDALRYNSEALAVARRAYPQGHPEVATALYIYGELLRQAGRFDEAMRGLDEARTIRLRNGLPGELGLVELSRIRVLIAQGQHADALALVDAIQPELERVYGASSTVVMQMLAQQIAALTQHDPQHRMAQQIGTAEHSLAQLDAAHRWHPVAQYLRWRIAHACHMRGNADGATRLLTQAELPAGSPPQLSTTRLLLDGLRLRVAISATASASAVTTRERDLREALLQAPSASNEALAYGWLSLAQAATQRADTAALHEALSAVEAVQRERPLPAEYAEALRAWRRRQPE